MVAALTPDTARSARRTSSAPAAGQPQFRQAELFSFVPSPVVERRELPDGSVVLRARALDEWIDAATARQVLFGMSRETLYALLDAGEIEGVQPNVQPGQRARNHKWRISAASVLRYRERISGGR